MKKKKEGKSSTTYPFYNAPTQLKKKEKREKDNTLSKIIEH